MQKTVGRKYPIEKKEKKKTVIKLVEFGYSKLPFDKNGFAESSSYLPLPFDLVWAEVTREGKVISNLLPAWWDGNKWCGRKIKRFDLIKRWKKAHLEGIIW